MKSLFSLICIFTICIDVNSQESTNTIDELIVRINNEVPPENGCANNKISYNECMISYSMDCGENSFIITMDLNKIERVYKDKADLEDTFETLFFECKGGKNCITSNSERIPPFPVFPLRLPEGDSSTLGEDAVREFTVLIDACE